MFLALPAIAGLSVGVASAEPIDCEDYYKIYAMSTAKYFITLISLKLLLIGCKVRADLGNSVTVARVTLNHLLQVRILVPQLSWSRFIGREIYLTSATCLPGFVFSVRSRAT